MNTIVTPPITSLASLSKQTLDFLMAHNARITSAESCTAGMFTSSLADNSGSSACLESAFVVYSPQAKIELLGVNPLTIEKFDITSQEVAREMASGALARRPTCRVAVAVTGLASADGGTAQIPAGTICFAWGYKTRRSALALFSQTVRYDTALLPRNALRAKCVEHMHSMIVPYFHQAHRLEL